MGPFQSDTGTGTRRWGESFKEFYWKEKPRHTGKFHQNKLPHSFYSTVVDGSPILQHGPAQKRTQGLAEKQKSVGLTSGLAPFLTSL